MSLDPTPQPSMIEATKVWWKIGLLSFGGPAAQIALMHREIVEQRRWLQEKQFLGALSFCMLLPGPEAMQLATYSGWRLHGTLGGLIAGLFFILPGACVIMVLAAIYSTYGNVPLVSALFYGIKAAVLVVVVEALIRVAKKALNGWLHWVIAAGAFVGIFFLSLPYPLIVLIAAVVGYFTSSKHQSTDTSINHNTSFSKTASTIVLWLAIWLIPLFALSAIGAPDILIEIGRFFSKLAVVTFGGAYAVLAYMAQDVVTKFEWLSAGEMIDALGLAETTPGPLILVTQFVGFLAAFKDGGVWLGIGAATVALWVTFAPCFLWIFAGAPYIEWISNQSRLKGALEAITAAVVGVILNLSIWFALHVLFGTVTKTQIGWLTVWWPEIATLEWLAVGLFAASCFLALRLHRNILTVLGVSAIAGAVIRLMIG